jgi:prophage tail gpP-like protein
VNELQHKITLQVGKDFIDGWTDYDIECDMLGPADGFNISLGPATPEIWAMLETDQAFKLLLDDNVVMSGRIDAVEGNSDKGGGDRITVRGRDIGGRLVDDDMELISLGGIGIVDLAKKIVAPFGLKVITSNAKNRRLIRGSGSRGGRISSEPAIDTSAKPPRKVQPGEKRWGVLERYLQEGRLLAWMTADGTSLVVGKPNYAQEPTFNFFHAGEGSARAAEANVESFKIVKSVEQRYSKIVVCGSGPGDDGQNDGERVVRFRGEAKNGTGAQGVGNSFKLRKVLVLRDDAVTSNRDAKNKAEREMAERDATGNPIELVVNGHAQWQPGARKPTLYGFDMTATVESEVFGIKGEYLITRVSFRQDRSSGEVTQISLVPKGTELTQ